MPLVASIRVSAVSLARKLFLLPLTRKTNSILPSTLLAASSTCVCVCNTMVSVCNVCEW